MNATGGSELHRRSEGVSDLHLPELAALALYAVVVGFAIHFHEPWADEAQAWEIARSSSLAGMVHLLGYEGSPGLWHLLLWCLNRLHVSYAGMHWFSGLIAVGGVATLLFWSPFPRWLKLALPFTFFLAFQYAVVARSYVLAPVGLFLLACLWKRRFERPIAVAVILGLMANIALHLAMFSAGFAICYAIELWRIRRREQQIPARPLTLAVLLLAGFYLLAIVSARPPHDIAYPQGLSPLLAPEARQLEQQSKLRHAHSLEGIKYQFQEKLTAPLASGLVLPLSLALLFWLVLAWGLFRERKLIYLIPGALFALFCHFVGARPWHSGLVFPYILAVLWMAWPVQLSFRARARHEQPHLRIVRHHHGRSNLLGRVRPQLRSQAPLFAWCGHRLISEAIRKSWCKDCRNRELLRCRGD